MEPSKKKLKPTFSSTKLLDSQNKETGEILFLQSFLSEHEAWVYFEALVNVIVWQKKKVKIFGKEVMQPRLVAFSNKDRKSYPYSGQTIESQEWIPELEELAQLLKDVLSESFDSVHMNWYRNGKDYIGFHSDNEPLWGKNPTIASISLGATRKFILKEKDGTKQIEYELEHGSLIVMKGATQQYWKHSIPKQTTIKESRINLTFRKMV